MPQNFFRARRYILKDIGNNYLFEAIAFDDFFATLGAERVSADFEDGLRRYVRPFQSKEYELLWSSYFLLLSRCRHTNDLKAFLLCCREPNSNKGHLHALFVNPESRREGIGSICLRYATGILVARGVTRLFVSFTEPDAWRGRLYLRFCDEVIPLYHSFVKFCVVLDSKAPRDKQIREWYPGLRN